MLQTKLREILQLDSIRDYQVVSLIEYSNNILQILRSFSTHLGLKRLTF